MNNNEFQTVGLYDHNADSYRIIKSSFESGKNIVGIVHATGTGKSYNALQLAYDNKDKKIVYVVPSNGIIEHLNKIIEDNYNLDLKRDFPNLEFRTYQSFISLSEDEIANINCDLLVLDEFHHIGASVWGARINTMIETHPEIKIFGMTAYTVRDRGTSYERDMANPETDELFSGKIESRYDLCDAMIDGVLPKPIYKSAYTNLIGLESKLEEKVQKTSATTKEYQEYMSILTDVKKRIHEAPSISNILKKLIKPNGKYIYFCPPCSEEGTNDIETIKRQAIKWFKEFIPEGDIIIYTSTSEMGEEGKLNRDSFYRDVTLDGKKIDNKFRIMFAINQYNEGIHAPNIDGVIMGRGTTSDIVYFEQLGRALSVRGNTKDKFEELEQYSIEQLINMCKEKDIPVKDDISKEELIEKLLAPVVIDLTNNYEFIKELENNLKDRIKLIEEKGLGTHRISKIKDASFDIEIENQDIFEMLRYVMDRMTMTWDDKYELAKQYYEHHNNLEIPVNFKTINGYEYDENGVALGNWIHTQRKAYKAQETNKVTQERINKLKEIGMIFGNINDTKWEEKYKLAKQYYEHHNNLEIPWNFKTINGYEHDENGIALGEWIHGQRRAYNGKGTYKITEAQINKLKEIGMIFGNINDTKWEEKYKLAKQYYEHHNNLEIPVNFKTINGYEYDENGVALGAWIQTQRQAYKGQGRRKITENQINKLKEIGMIFENVNDTRWKKMYELAKQYYEHNNNLEIPTKFKTTNGYEYDENGYALGAWIQNQRTTYKEQGRHKIPEDQINKLKEIGMIFENVNDTRWEKMYELAQTFYIHNNNLAIPVNFKTTNGYEYDENGETLGLWIFIQRQAYKGKGTSKITEEQVNKLKEIGMIFESINDNRWEEMYKLAQTFYIHNNNLAIPVNFKTTNGYEYDENGYALGAWIQNQRTAYKGQGRHKITEAQINKLEKIGIIWFDDKLDNKLQQEQITIENLKRKKTELQNRFYSLLSNFDNQSLPSSEELNQNFIDQLDTPKKR